MSQKARMERADALFPTVMYTGTTSVFDEFSPEESGKGSGIAQVDGAVWATSDPEVASYFALFPLQDPYKYLIALVRKANLGEWYNSRATAEQLTIDNPKLKEAMGTFADTLAKHKISEKNWIGKLLSEKPLRTAVLEDAERIADTFATITGTRVSITPVVMPLRINDADFIAKDFEGSSIEEITNLNDDYVRDMRMEAERKESGGITLHNVADGIDKHSTIMAIKNYARIRSIHAAFDPDRKDEAGLMY